MFDTCGIADGGGGPGIPPRNPDFFQCQGTMQQIQCKGYDQPGRPIKKRTPEEVVALDVKAIQTPLSISRR